MYTRDVRWINRAIRTQAHSGTGRVYVNEDEQGCGRVIRARTWKGQLQVKLTDSPRWHAVPYVSIVWGEAGTGEQSRGEQSR